MPALPAQGSTAWYTHYSSMDSSVRSLLSGTPTLEELERAASLGTVTGTTMTRIGAVNFDQRIGGFTISTSAAITASDTDYWSVSLMRLRAGQNPLTIATRTTR